jgi:hypothetical protein
LRGLAQLTRSSYAVRGWLRNAPVESGKARDVTASVEVVAGTVGLEMFLGLPQVVYRNDPFSVTPSQVKVRAGIFRPDFEGHQKLFVVARGQAPVARALARVSPTLCDAGGKPLGMIGFFEAREDADGVRELFRSAVSWLCTRGVGDIVGPMDGDTWHSYRLNIGPFDHPPFLMEPYQRPYYRALWEEAGFRELERYYSMYVEDIDGAIAGTEAIARRAESSGAALRPFDMTRFGDELRVLYRLSRAIFAGNYLYTDISFEDFALLYQDARRLLDPELIWFARSARGEDVAFVFALPDNIRAVRALGGEKGLLSLARFFLLKNRTDTVNVKTLGLLPEVRGTGISVLLVNRVYHIIRDKGFRRANLCLIRQGNPSGRLDGGQGKPLREYLLYHLPRGEGPRP